MTVRRTLGLICSTLVFSLAILTAPACAAPQGRLYVRVGPPVAVVERVPLAPGPAYIWVPGYHRWDGVGYLWVPGQYVVAPRPRARWVPGHWKQDRRGWYWVDGRWR